MLLTFLYHRVCGEKYSNSLEMIEKQFRYFSQKYRILVPGEKISLLKTDICLTFDDAYFDFYHYVFPLLKKLQIRAVLGVPVGKILPSTTSSEQERLSISSSLAMNDENYKKAPFCTWEEIIEMDRSGYVYIASHGFTHANLLDSSQDLDLEIRKSKLILEEKLQKPIMTFIYPYGAFDKKIHAYVRKYYRYAMRIGSTFNLSWQNCSEISYRIISDHLQSIEDPLHWYRYVSYLWFYLVNSLRHR
ncbi:MAG: polysaccharide deacetylase family protein [Parachlamydiales bacterium]|nr:polysaccharide deacetylase family protein [Parachlamydiales bacterium]